MGILVLGCAGKGVRYTYKTLPTPMLATKWDNVQTLDLTRLARPTITGDVIDRGDVIEVTIAAGLDEKDSIKMPVRVNDQGIAELPEIGEIRVAGLEMEAAEAAIVATCIERQLYLRPNVTVEMKHQRKNRVSVVGAVENPDVYELPRGRSDLLAAIVAAGGLKKEAGTKVEIRNPRRVGGSRPAPVALGTPSGIDTVGHSNPLSPTDAITADTNSVSNISSKSGGSSSGKRIDVIPVVDADGRMETFSVDLVSATKAGTGGYLIEDGGVVSIEKRDPEPLHLIGLVRNPNKYDYPFGKELRVTDAIALAGGTSMSLADKIFIVRHIPQSTETAVIQVSLSQAKRIAQANVLLQPGDVVSVEQTPATAIYELFQVFRFNMGVSAPAAGLF